MNHADPVGDGVTGRVEGDGRPVDLDLTLVRTLHAVEDLHERGLACAVLPDDGVDPALRDLQIDVSVRDDSGESLGDPGELYSRFCGGRGGNGGLLLAECLVTDIVL
ncbi:hypothetical protein Psi02_36530 [Planotetraspora silvatica]|uniref:Uncharacterized protein n=1 Tax=Planotetraspora silvatica TaxID=234614 RepID=A0A8J3UK15_9ACTN|nr:hypothetical protein Psi02_36530 [Planotetraspora silvatica]